MTTHFSNNTLSQMQATRNNKGAIVGCKRSGRLKIIKGNSTRTRTYHSGNDGSPFSICAFIFLYVYKCIFFYFICTKRVSLMTCVRHYTFTLLINIMMTLLNFSKSEMFILNPRKFYFHLKNIGTYDIGLLYEGLGFCSF